MNPDLATQSRCPRASNLISLAIRPGLNTISLYDFGPPFRFCRLQVVRDRLGHARPLRGLAHRRAPAAMCSMIDADPLRRQSSSSHSRRTDGDDAFGGGRR